MAEEILLGDLCSESRVAELLTSHFREEALPAKTALLVQCGRCLSGKRLPSDTRACAYWVPGRIEVLGKHTDYAGGRSLLAASERGFCFVAVEGIEQRVEAFDALSGETTGFGIDPELTPATGHWPNFPMTVARRFCRNFNQSLRGVYVAFASDLPRAAGMSSSSAMLIGFSLVMLDLNRLSHTFEFRKNIPDLESLAGYLATIENGQTFRSLLGDKGVGTFGGSEDHTAILCCQPQELSQYSFCPIQFERRIRLPENLTLAIAVSGVSSDKTGAAMQDYNRACRQASEVSRIWRERTGFPDPHLAAILTRCGGPDPLLEILEDQSHPEFCCEELINRVRQFHGESEEIVPAAGDALLQEDFETLGKLVDRSQGMAESILRNQVPQTAFLALVARQLGAIAASAFGAGFGGSVWALLHRSGAGDILEEWANSYGKKHPEESTRAVFFLSGAGPAARRLFGPVDACPVNS